MSGNNRTPGAEASAATEPPAYHWMVTAKWGGNTWRSVYDGYREAESAVDSILQASQDQGDMPDSVHVLWVWKPADESAGVVS